MSPQLGQKFEACIESGAARDGLLDFERFMHFSAGTTDKFMERYTSSDRDIMQQAAFIGHLTSLAGAEDLDEAVISETTTSESHRRVLDIHGIFMIETATVDRDGMTQEVTYEASLVSPVVPGLATPSVVA